MNKLNVLKKEVSMIKAAKKVYTLGRICSIGAVIVASVFLFLDFFKVLK